MTKPIRFIAALLVSGLIGYSGVYISSAVTVKYSPSGVKKAKPAPKVSRRVKIDMPKRPKVQNPKMKAIDNLESKIIEPDSTLTNKPLAKILEEKKIGGPDFGITIKVTKSKGLLTVFSRNIPLKTYKISLGPQPSGRKTREGDGKTPEGSYIIVERLDSNLSSRLGTRWIRINYPNEDDADVALKEKIIDEPVYNSIANAAKNKTIPPQATVLGGGLGLHGAGGPGTTTRGCIGLANGDIEEIYAFINIGTPITIEP